jgi:hypothetical protein
LITKSHPADLDHEVISAKKSVMLGATISALESVLFKFRGHLDGFKRHSFLTIGT